MRTRHTWSRTAVALAMAASLALFPFLDVVRAQAPATPAAAKPAAKPAAAAPQPVDGGWPKAFSAPSGATVVMYQPQIASWTDQKHMVAYSAVGYEKKGAEKPTLGSVKIESDTSIALDERLVHFVEFKLTEVSFEKLDRDEAKEVTTEIDKAIPDGERVIGLDRILASVDKSQIIPKNVEGVKADPPKVFYSTTPAVLVNIDDEPIWSPIKDNDLKYAINTNWDLFQHGPTNSLYLRNEKVWLKATTVDGPWTPAGTLPESFKKLPADENWKDVKASLPGQKPSGKTPTVFVSTAPAELILVTGAPNYLLVDGTTDLLWVQNTVSDVFRVGRTGPVYFLVSGRWFSAPDFTGPWTFATTKLPPQFAKIPAGAPAVARAGLGAGHSAGRRSRAARAGAADGAGEQEGGQAAGREIRRPAEVRCDPRHIARAGDQHRQGHHQGRRPLLHVLPGRVVHVAERRGPVGGREHRAEGDLLHSGQLALAQRDLRHGRRGRQQRRLGHLRRGRGLHGHDDRVGLRGVGHRAGTIRPTSDTAATTRSTTRTTAPTARPPGTTRGPAPTGAAPWPTGRTAAWERPHGTTRTRARTRVARRPMVRTAHAAPRQAYNPRTGTYAATRQGSNVYGNWGSSYVQRGDDWARTGHVTNRRTGTTTSGIRTDEGGAVRRSGPGGSGFVGTNGDNVYAGHDGNVYKRGDDGSWQKRENGGWNNTNRPDPSTSGQLDRDRAARAEGATRTKDYGNYRSSGGRSAGTYRSGGGSRGGGGRGGGGRRR